MLKELKAASKASSEAKAEQDKKIAAKRAAIAKQVPPLYSELGKLAGTHCKRLGREVVIKVSMTADAVVVNLHDCTRAVVDGEMRHGFKDKPCREYRARLAGARTGEAIESEVWVVEGARPPKECGDAEGAKRELIRQLGEDVTFDEDEEE